MVREGFLTVNVYLPTSRQKTGGGYSRESGSAAHSWTQYFNKTRCYGLTFNVNEADWLIVTYPFAYVVKMPDSETLGQS